MGTECISEALLFQGPGRREIRADFDGGDISSDAGALLLREVEHRTGIIEQFSQCFDDHRDPCRIEHSARDLIAQRVFGMALGYEDLNDHEDLRFDPLLATVVGKTDPKGLKRSRLRDRGAGLAGKKPLQDRRRQSTSTANLVGQLDSAEIASTLDEVCTDYTSRSQSPRLRPLLAVRSLIRTCTGSLPRRRAGSWSCSSPNHATW